MNGIFHLTGTVKHYDWGGFSFIPGLIKQENPDKRPFAEYWLGIHPLGVSTVETSEGKKKLSDCTKSLPFLLKVLDVNKMLSIQVHPSLEEATEGFEQENRKGIDLDAPDRVFKDANHKPEMMVALGDFWLLHGFKPEKELVFTLLNVVELRELLPVFNKSGYSGLYRHVMEMPQSEVNRILGPMRNMLSDLYGKFPPDREDEDYWAARAFHLFCPEGDIDRGIFSIFLMNLVQLKKGEGIFQGAGLPHAYLEGRNVEIMANSDNVLRGGLTSKYIDIEGLLKHVSCIPTQPSVLTGSINENDERVFEVPVPDFRLGVFEMVEKEQIEFISGSMEILLLTEGQVRVSDEHSELELGNGNPAALITPGRRVVLNSEKRSILFRAGLPS